MTKRRSLVAVLATGLLIACSGESDAPGLGGRGGDLPAEVGFRGMYSNVAAAALFTECATGLTYPVAAEGASATLESAYLELQTDLGEPLLVSLRGYLAPRPRADGGTEEALVPTVFETVFIGQACGGTAAGQPLEGSEWTALEVMGISAPAEDPPTFIIAPAEGLVAWSGCAEFTGAYRLRGAQLQFSDIDPRAVPCSGSLGRTEQAFIQALQGTGSYEIRGDTLLLIGEGGVLARFTWR